MEVDLGKGCSMVVGIDQRLGFVPASFLSKKLIRTLPYGISNFNAFH